MVLERVDVDVAVVERPAVHPVDEDPGSRRRPRSGRCPCRAWSCPCNRDCPSDCPWAIVGLGWKPCSTMAMRTFGLDRAMARPIRPVSPAGSPFVSFVHVLPPSVVLKMPPFGPPESKRHGRRSRCQNADVKTFGIGRVHDQVDRPGLAVVRQAAGRAWPGRSAVGRLEQAAVARCSPRYGRTRRRRRRSGRSGG